jgi:hypothetical protein
VHGTGQPAPPTWSSPSHPTVTAHHLGHALPGATKSTQRITSHHTSFIPSPSQLTAHSLLHPNLSSRLFQILPLTPSYSSSSLQFIPSSLSHPLHTSTPSSHSFSLYSLNSPPRPKRLTRAPRQAASLPPRPPHPDPALIHPRRSRWQTLGHTRVFPLHNNTPPTPHLVRTERRLLIPRRPPFTSITPPPSPLHHGRIIEQDVR